MTESLWNGMTLETPAGEFPLGADSVLLADFARIPKGAAVCDLGCGCGAIALMLLANDPTCAVTGVEIRKSAADAARQNAARNGAALRVIDGDLRRVQELLPAGAFEHAVSNPPYHTANGDPARTETLCTAEDLCAAAAWLLRPGGRFSLIHRIERMTDVLCALRGSGLEPKRMRCIRHRAGAKRSLFLMEAVRCGKAGLTLEEDLILYREDGGETEECRRAYHREEVN